MADDNEQEGLSEFQIAEIKKAFAICDQDGDGAINANELRVVIRTLLDEDPSDEEFQQILLTLDKDHDGRIEWAEFLSAMTEWFTEEYKSRTTTKRRKLNVEQERQEVHSKIKSFFQQFKKGDNFDIVRQKLSRSHSRSTDKSSMDVESGSGFYFSGSGRDSGKLSSADKLEFLKWYRSAMGNLPSLLNALGQDNRFDHMQATQNLAKMLSIVEVFSTPSERRAVAEDIVSLFEQLYRQNVMTRLIYLLRDNSQHALQYNILKCVTYFAPGPRIASTPKESPLHPSFMLFKKILIAEGALPAAYGLLNHPVNDVREQAVVAIGSIAAHNPECRDYILQNNGMPLLLQLVSTSTPVDLLRKVSWALSILCGVTHPLNKLPPWDAISGSFFHLATLLFSTDESVVCHALSAMALILPGVHTDLNFPRRMVELLGPSSTTRIVNQALDSIKAIVQFDNTQTEVLLNQCNLLDALKKLATAPDMSVRIATAELLGALANSRGLIQPLVNSGILEMILRLIALDEHVRWKFVKVIKYATRGTPAQVGYLVQKGAIGTLCKALVHFKEYDRVLTEIYKHSGPAYNFDFVRDILTCLDNIVTMGELDSEDHNTATNKYALQFDLESIDRMRGLLQAIKDSRPEDINAWRHKKADETGSVENKTKHLLRKIKLAHDGPADKPTKVHVSRMIAEIWQAFFADADAAASGPVAPVTPAPVQSIALKCYYGDDIRVVEVSRDATFEEIYTSLSTKFGGHALQVTYVDEDGDYVTVDSISTLEKAVICQNAHRTQKAVKLHLFERPVPLVSSPIGSPVGSPMGVMSPLMARVATDDVASPGGRRKRGADGAQKEETHQSVVNSAIIFPMGKDVLKSNQKLFGKQAITGLTLTGDLDDLKREQQRQVFADLEVATHFGKAELEQLFSDWAKTGSEDGQVNRTQFESGMNALGITDPLIIEQNFSAFDQNKDGLIDFREFVCGLSTVLRGDMEERLRFMFRSYDTQNRGYLTREEIYKIFKASSITSGQQAPESEILKAVEDCFAEIDVDGDGKLSYDEFKHAVETQKLQINCSVHYSANQ